MAKKRASSNLINDPLWYKDAVIYQVHIKSFFDANNDGIGDFPGLISKLDYIADLGVNTVWLLPFYPSPRRDDGYDIADYRGVHPDYGTLADVKRFINEAHQRGLRVITELVINHTSDQHPWFQKARHAKAGSKARDYYVWSDSDQKYAGTRIIFLDTETSNWTWDPVAGQYFWHRFYAHQPDLNFDNPQVIKEVLSVMRFWLDMGIDGLRLDAIPYLIQRDGTNNENLPETHQILKQIRAEIDAHYPDRMLLAEANQWPEDTRQYFGDSDGIKGDECHMAFHFPLMPRLYMALAQEDRFPITDILRQTPPIPAHCQWAIFLRNHDELTLEMVTDKERDALWNHYAPDRRARINLGIRRRLAPLMERDRRRIELLNSVLLSMPGTPTLYYGDEIGMGDNIYLNDRDGVRTPMQWSMDLNGGFSRANPASLVLAPITDPLYGYQAVNVEAQALDPHSLLNWTRRLLAVRKQQKAFGRGSLNMLSPRNRRVLAYVREFTDALGNTQTIVCVANVSRSAQAVELDLSTWAGRVPVEMLSTQPFPPIGPMPYSLTLAPYGFYWFLLVSENAMPDSRAHPVHSLPERVTLVLKQRFEDVLEPPLRTTLERDILPAWLADRRWLGHTAALIEQVKIVYGTSIPAPELPVLLTEVQITAAGQQRRYQLVLGLISEDEPDSVQASQPVLCRVRQGREIGLVTEAFNLPPFVRAVLAGLQHARTLDTDAGQIRFSPTVHLAPLALDERSEIGELTDEQAHCSVVIGGTLMLKLLREVSSGLHPALEMAAWLTAAGYAHVPPLLGSVVRYDEAGDGTLLMIAQRYVPHQGDARAWTQNILEQAIRAERASTAPEPAQPVSALAELADFAALLGQRLGELHHVLAQPTDNPDFAPQIIGADDVSQWAAEISEQVRAALQQLNLQGPVLPARDQAQIRHLLKHQQPIVAYIEHLATRTLGGLKIRVHGDLHLGQVLVVHGDACFIGFEGNPARTLQARRSTHSPYTDLCALLRSFEYAGAMAINNVQQADHPPEADRVPQQVVERYLKEARSALIQAYSQATASLAQGWQVSGGHEAALALFSLEKAAYEVMYQAANRPAWSGVPLQGLSALLSHLPGMSKPLPNGDKR